LRAVAVGCGAIAEEHLAFLGTSELVELAAVCDLSPALAEIARDRHGAGYASTDLDDVLIKVRPDVVHVLTPPRTHPDLIRRSLAAGAHVVCEKPLAPTADETRALLVSARAASRVLIETRNVLYNDVVLRFDRALADGRVGELREIDVSLALDLASADIPEGGLGLPAGIAHDYLPHLAYLLLHFAGSPEPPEIVAGTIDNLSGSPSIGFDHVDVLITLGHVRARLRISPDVVPGGMRVAVRGTNGSLEADIYQPYLRHEGPPWVGKLSPLDLVVQGATLIRAGGGNLRDRLLQHGTYHGMPRLLTDVYEALRDGRPSPVAEEDMQASATLIDRIVELAAVRA
jgi:predicted dehydrogenase